MISNPIKRQNLLVWTLCCVIGGGVFLAYALTSLAAGRGQYVLPLDDVYIHFQYAKQLATGQPFVYNPGQPPTSGATSLLYPFVLAAGYDLGFQGLNLGLWALIVGTLALVGSLWLVYRLTLAYAAPFGLALLLMVAFGLTGAVSWHFMTGMETGLVIFALLLTLLMIIENRAWGFVLAATLLGLLRPEGSMLAALAAVVFYLIPRSEREQKPQRQRLVLLPVLVIFVQPIVNWLVTGSPVATGNSAKSIMGAVPFDWLEVIRRITENFARMWWEFLTAYSPREGWYVPLLLVPLGLIGLLWLLRDPHNRRVGVILALWLLAGTAMIATLDTAFWHFKRYQMPLLALFYPLAGWGLAGIFYRKDANAQRRKVFFVYAYGAIVAIFVAGTAWTFLWAFGLNVGYVYAQPLQMARWLQANTPEDALIAVHDVGMMRYMGERTTLDMVGLTTPGAADYWRNGPGSLAEFLIANQPDYIASYGHGHGYGLGMLADTSLYGKPLAAFPVMLDPHYNVALAADFQGIYAPDWRLLIDRNPFLRNMPLVEGSQVVNVANLVSESDMDYQWSVGDGYMGFATLPYDLRSGNCQNPDYTEVDAVRAVQQESFTITANPGESLLLMSMFHPVERGTYDVYVNDTHLDRNWIPETLGCWSIARTVIPGDLIESDSLTIRIEAQTEAGFYLPAHHAVIAQEPTEFNPDEALGYFQERAFGLMTVEMLYNPGSLHLPLLWYAQAQVAGDFRLFVHLYNDVDSPPVAQVDTYVFRSPPGNWPPGILLDTVVVNLDEVPPGAYRVALGFYDPYTLERLQPESNQLEISPDGRLFIGEIEVQ